MAYLLKLIGRSNGQAARNHRSDSAVGKKLADEGVGNATIDNVATLNPGECPQAGFDFRNHSPGDHLLGDQVLRLQRRKLGQKVLVDVEHAGYVSQENDLGRS